MTLFFELDDCDRLTWNLFVKARNAFLRSIGEREMDLSLLTVTDNYHVIDHSWWFETAELCKQHIMQMKAFFAADREFVVLVESRIAVCESNSCATKSMKTVLDTGPYTGSMRDLGSCKFGVGMPIRRAEWHEASQGAAFMDFFANADFRPREGARVVLSTEKAPRTVWDVAKTCVEVDESSLPERMLRTRNAWRSEAL